MENKNEGNESTENGENLGSYLKPVRIQLKCIKLPKKRRKTTSENENLPNKKYKFGSDVVSIDWRVDHRKKPSFVCTMCAKGFSSASALSYHEIYHPELTRTSLHPSQLESSSALTCLTLAAGSTPTFWTNGRILGPGTRRVRVKSLPDENLQFIQDYPVCDSSSSKEKESRIRTLSYNNIYNYSSKVDQRSETGKFNAQIQRLSDNGELDEEAETIKYLANKRKSRRKSEISDISDISDISNFVIKENGVGEENVSREKHHIIKIVKVSNDSWKINRKNCGESKTEPSESENSLSVPDPEDHKHLEDLEDPEHPGDLEHPEDHEHPEDLEHVTYHGSLEDLRPNEELVEPKFFDEDDFDIIMENSESDSIIFSEPCMNGVTQKSSVTPENLELLNGLPLTNGLSSPHHLYPSTLYKRPFVSLKRLNTLGLCLESTIQTPNYSRLKNVISPSTTNRGETSNGLESEEGSEKIFGLESKQNNAFKDGPVAFKQFKSPKLKKRKKRFSLEQEKPVNVSKSSDVANPPKSMENSVKREKTSASRVDGIHPRTSLKSYDTSSGSAGSERRFSERRFQGEKPYMCNHCPLTFRSYQNRVVHERTHKEKPFECTFCEMRFSLEMNMKRHAKIHR